MEKKIVDIKQCMILKYDMYKHDFNQVLDNFNQLQNTLPEDICLIALPSDMELVGTDYGIECLEQIKNNIENVIKELKESKINGI